MIFSTFLNTNIEGFSVTPKQKIKQDFEHYKQVLNWSGKSDLIYNNLIDNIIWILETKYAKFNLRYTSSLVAYNELNIILSQQLPQWLFIQKKQALENLETFADLNNWGSVLKDRITRAITGNESGSNQSSFVPIDNANADPYEKSGSEKRAYSNDEVDESKQTVDYLYWFSRMKWQTASIDMNTILKPYLGLFILVANTDLATPIKEDQFETLQNQIVNTNDRIDQVVTAVDGEIDTVKNNITNINSSINELDNDLTRIENSLTSTNNELDSLEARVNGYDDRINEATNKANEANTKATNAEEQATRLGLTVSDNSTKIVALESKNIKVIELGISNFTSAYSTQLNTGRAQAYYYPIRKLNISKDRIISIRAFNFQESGKFSFTHGPLVVWNTWEDIVIWSAQYNTNTEYNIVGYVYIYYI